MKRWEIGRGDMDGKVIFLRIAESQQPNPSLPFRIGVAVPYAGTDSAQLPDEVASRDLSRFEDALFEYVESDQCELLAVITTVGMREFLFYGAQSDAAAHGLAKVRELVPDLRFQTYSAPDPDWSVYQMLVETLHQIH